MKIFKPHSNFKWKQNVSIFSLYDDKTMGYQFWYVIKLTVNFTSQIQHLFNQGELKMGLSTLLAIGLGGVIAFTVIYYFLTEWNAD